MIKIILLKKSFLCWTLQSVDTSFHRTIHMKINIMYNKMWASHLPFFVGNYLKSTLHLVAWLKYAGTNRRLCWDRGLNWTIHKVTFLRRKFLSLEAIFEELWNNICTGTWQLAQFPLTRYGAKLNTSVEKCFS